uniref:Uncharacterized protein n=1 Tax=Ascaris lumbricoides TaxID=6252 RepID=A0A0M3IER8_ASCLU
MDAIRSERPSFEVLVGSVQRHICCAHFGGQRKLVTEFSCSKNFWHRHETERRNTAVLPEGAARLRYVDHFLMCDRVKHGRVQTQVQRGAVRCALVV